MEQNGKHTWKLLGTILMGKIFHPFFIKDRTDVYRCPMCGAVIFAGLVKDTSVIREDIKIEHW